MNFNLKKNIIPILFVTIVILFFKSCYNNNYLKQQLGLYETAQESLLQTRNKLNQQVSKIAIFKAKNKKDFLKLQTKDSIIIALQKVVKNYKGKLQTATVLINNTTDIGNSITMIKYDTIKTDTGTYFSPIYTSNWNEKWSIGTIVASKDSITRNIKIKNDFTITQGLERHGFFKKRKSIITITNLNPNTITTELRTFSIQPHKNKISLGIGVAYGFDMIGLKPTIVIGPTIHIPLISL